MQGTVQRIEAANKLGFIQSDDGREFVFLQAALVGTDFNDLTPGTRVDFGVEEGGQTGEPPRAQSVSLVSEAKQSSGGDASGTGTGELVGMEPPDGVDGDEVAEASWESFPASDPPTWSRG